MKRIVLCSDIEFIVIFTMGNCLKRSTTDDISLLRGSDSVRESSSDQLGSTSAYQVNIFFVPPLFMSE